MKYQIFLTFIIFFALISCSEDTTVFENIAEEEVVEDLDGDTKERTNGRLSNYILAAVTDDSDCSVNGRTYTVYATAGRIVSYNRSVNVIITRGIDLIEQKMVVIPANGRKSSNKVVFSNASEQYGNVEVIVYEVFGPHGNMTNSFELRNTTQNVRNCYNSQPGGGGPKLDFCNGNDADGDGICDDIDPDGDGDGFPDHDDDNFIG